MDEKKGRRNHNFHIYQANKIVSNIKLELNKHTHTDQNEKKKKDSIQLLYKSRHDTSENHMNVTTTSAAMIRIK